MNIKDVTNAFKIADVELIEGQTKLNFKYLNKLYDENGNRLDPSILKENLARVYLIVMNGEIMKIGGSQAQGGIISTLRIYQDGGVGGRPSIRSFGIWYYLYNNALKGNKIEFYLIVQDNFEHEIKGLNQIHRISNAYVSYKLLEACCIIDYQKIHGHKSYPKWNKQERGADWPIEIKTEHANIYEQSLSRKNRRK